jgi:hypothetical protein
VGSNPANKGAMFRCQLSNCRPPKRRQS